VVSLIETSTHNQSPDCNLLRSVSNAPDGTTGYVSQIVTRPPSITLKRTGTGTDTPGCHVHVKTIAPSKPNCKTKTVHHFHNCHRLQCPTCFRGESAIQGRRVSERLNGLTTQYAKAGTKAGRPKHIVESKPGLLPESKKDDKKAVQAYIRACTQDLISTAKDGWYGGVHIFHPYRRKGLNKLTDEWETIEDNAPADNYIKTRWYWSPHVHFIVYGYYQNEAHYKETGFIQKVIVTEEDPNESVRKIATYLLTHSGIWIDNKGEQRGQAYAYFGAYSTRRGGRKWTGKRAEEHQFCEDSTCKCHLNDWQYHPVEASDVPMEGGRPILDLKRKSPVLTDNPLRSWEKDPHDIMHGWTVQPYIISRKLYVYLLSASPGHGHV
jgi:hypothetical protein